MISRAVSFFLLCLTLYAQQPINRGWEIKNNPSEIDSISATNGDCHLYFQTDGEIRISTFDPRADGLKSGLYHNILLAPNTGKTAMVVRIEDWTPGNITEFNHSLARYKGPDVFWKVCGKEMANLRADLLARFMGWHGIH